MAVDYSVTFAGTTLGNGATWNLTAIDGIEDLPEVRGGDSSKAYTHGEIPGLDLAGGRDVTLTLVTTATTDAAFAVAVEALKAATTPAVSESTLSYQLPGRAERSMRCRARRRSFQVGFDDYGIRIGRAVIAFHATDPRIYDLAFTTVSIGLPSAATGLTFNALAPFVFGSAGSGGSASVTNSGNFGAPWVATVIGPVTDPVLTLASTGQAVRLVGTVNAGETLVIDSLGRSVLLNGTASRYSWVQSGSAWWELPVGVSSVQFGATSGTGTCNFSYRSTWL